MWISIPTDSDFSIHNLPFGIFDTGDGRARAGIAIGDYIVDLEAAALSGLFGKRRFFAKIFAQNTLNAFIDLGKPITNRVRRKVQDWLNLSSKPDHADAILVNRLTARLHLPVRVPNYTDFYSSIEHATNVGKMFRPDNPLLPNWRHLPVGYHGRASSIVVSGTPIKRPSGQIVPKGEELPIMAATRQMDFELEMAFVMGKNTTIGDQINIDNAEDYIFGFLLFNDWSARDIQRWEYVPLGPFLGKNFGSSVSPWIVTTEALKPFRVKSPRQTPTPLAYLQAKRAYNFDINLSVWIKSQKNNTPTCICNTNYKYLYWTFAQQLAHHTVNGCNVETGDMMASGTISGPDKGSYGSMLELSWAGANPIPLTNDETRTFLLDGDTVSIKGYCEKDGIRVGFGEVSGMIIP